MSAVVQQPPVGSATVEQPPIGSAKTLTEYDDTSTYVERNAVKALDEHPHFHGRTNTIRVECRHGTLILTGRLPSFYLKQLLQETLRRVDGVGEIENRVDVICCNGVSSRRPKICS